jgi:hypothetical protein
MFSKERCGDRWSRARRIIVLLPLLVAIAMHAQQKTPETKPSDAISVRISSVVLRYAPGTDINVRVEIWNTSSETFFISKDVDDITSNAITSLTLTMYKNDQEIGPAMNILADSFSSNRTSYPPLFMELPRYWIALAPNHFYGTTLVFHLSSLQGLRAPGRYKLQGTYRSRGFLAQDINNPLAHYVQELKTLPFHVWTGEVKTNSLWIEIGAPSKNVRSEPRF